MGRGRGLSLFVSQGKAKSADTGRLCTDIRKICGASFLNLQELNGTLRTRFLHQHDLFFLRKFLLEDAKLLEMVTNFPDIP